MGGGCEWMRVRGQQEETTEVVQCRRRQPKCCSGRERKGGDGEKHVRLRKMPNVQVVDREDVGDLVHSLVSIVFTKQRNATLPSKDHP